MKQYAKNLAEVMKDAKIGFPKYLDLSDPLHRDLVSGYFGGEQVMQEQYPLLYKSYSKAVEQGLGEVSYEGFCDNALIYGSKYDRNTKKVIASGRVSLTEMAKMVFVSLNILQGETVVMQKNNMYSNCKVAQISCETNEIVEEIGDGSGYRVYLHVSWQPKNSEALRSMAAAAPEINAQSDIIVEGSQYINKMELYAPTKRNGNSCSGDTINLDENHCSYDNINEPVFDENDKVYICYQRWANDMDYTYPNEKKNGLQKVFVPGHFKVFLANGWKYKQLVYVIAVISPGAGGGDIFYLSEDSVIETEDGNSSVISVALDEDWHNTIPENVTYGSRVYRLDIHFKCIIQNKNNQSTSVEVEVNGIKGGETVKGTDIIHVAPVYLYWGCLAEGTKILMADGSEKEIQNIKTGDLIVNSKGESIRVTELITGTEQYIYRVVTEGGRKVSASYNHPFVTEQGDGLLLGFDYQTKLLVKEGNQYVYDLLSYCYPEEYNGNVYSITVEGGENTVIADGFVTWTNDAVERIERETFVSEDAVLTSAEQEEFDRLKAWIENR